MSSSTTELWQAVLGQLELSISGANFRTWIKTLSLSDVTPPVATINTPNFMSKNYVEKKFGDAILAALTQINPDITKVNFDVKKSVKKDRALDEIFTNKPDNAAPAQKPTPSQAKPQSVSNQAPLQSPACCHRAKS